MGHVHDTELEIPAACPLQHPESAVAVVGVACRFAGADSVDELWQVLETGTTHITSIAKHRFPDRHFEPLLTDTSLHGSFINDLKAFDHRFFNVSSREASFRDPQQRLALELSYQALESAGYFSQATTEEQHDIGCYFAATMNEYHDNVATHAPSAYSLTGSIRPFIAGQVSHFFGLTGPAVMIDAACAASGAAVNIACRAVASGECKSAIVGATNAFISPDTFHELAHAHFISHTGPSRPFDAAADGYSRGEGAAVLVLKKLSDALNDGDVIRGVVSATATNQCANESPIIVPHGPSQAALYQKALRLAQVEPGQIGYIEAHGTGTRVGDPIEVESIRSVFGHGNHTLAQKTYLGSLKSNIGHTEATAGLSGLIKVMLMIEKGIIPKQALFNKLHPAIAPLEPHGLQIATKSVPWSSPYRAGCVNNYGASGMNAVMILTQPPDGPAESKLARADTFPISITAFSYTSLKSYCSALLEFINRSDVSDTLALEIAFQLSRRRNPRLPFSVTSQVSNLGEMQHLLQSTVDGTLQKADVGTSQTVLFFGGQGGKPASVSRALYDCSAIFRKHLDACDSALQAIDHQSMFPTIFQPDSSDGSILALSKLFSVQYSSAKAWIDSGLQPSLLIGHSFGQLTALCVSGVLSLQDALYLVISRARLIEDMWGPDAGSMIAVEASEHELSKLMVQHNELALEKACYNGPRNFVLAGPTPSVDAIEASLKASKLYNFKRLLVPYAFHSKLAQTLVEPLKKVAEQLSFQEPKIPVETCSEGSSWPSITPSLVASHIREPVYFHQAVQRIAKRLGPSVWIEAGSGDNVAMLHRALEPQSSDHVIKSFKIDSASATNLLAEQTAGLWRSNVKVQFWPFHSIQRQQYRILDIPPYQFDRTRHWLDWQELTPQPAVQASSVSEKKPFIQLVRETKNVYEFQVNTQSEKWRAACTENRIFGSSTCPLSLLISLLSDAISAVRGTSTHIYRVQQLRLPVPISAEMKERLILEVGRADSSQLWSFRLTTGINSGHEFANGTVFLSEGMSQRDLVRFERLVDITRIEQLEANMEADCARGKGVYKLCADVLQFPRSSQVIHSLSFNSSEAAASLKGLSKLSLVALECLIQVPLICLNGMQERSNSHVFINTAVGDAHFQSCPTQSVNEAISHSVYVKFFELGEVEVTADIYVFSTHNRRLCGVILDLNFARISSTHALDGNTTILHLRPADSDVSHREVHSSRMTTAPECPGAVPSPSLSSDTKSSQSDSLPDLTQSLYDVLVRIADVEADRLHGTALLVDLGIDSLMGMEVADEINKVFTTDFEMTDFITVEDVDSLCRLVASRASHFFYAQSKSHTSVTSDSYGDTDLPSSKAFLDCHEELGRERQSSIEITSVYKAFDEIRTDFDILAREAGCDTFWSEVHPAQMRLIKAYCIEALIKLGCDLNTIQEGETIPSIPHTQASDNLFRRMMLILRDEGLIIQSDNAWLRSDKRISSLPSSVDQFSQILVEFPKWAPEHKLLHLAGSNLAGHFDGTQDPLKLFFGSSERRKLMADQYASAPIQSTVSRQLSRFILKCFATQKRRMPLQILEVGGGTCGTTVYTLEAFAKAGVPVEYTFTDISSSFISAAKSKLKKYQNVKYQTLDVSQNPTQLIGTFDMIFATNVIHATPDAARSASNVRQMLKDGGLLTMIEYTHAHATVDVIFGQFEGWWLFNDGRTHAIMDTAAWRQTLLRAGFNKVDWTGSQTRESQIARIIIAS